MTIRMHSNKYYPIQEKVHKYAVTVCGPSDINMNVFLCLVTFHMYDFFIFHLLKTSLYYNISFNVLTEFNLEYYEDETSILGTKY